jgi:hypothetical protein
MGAAGAPLGLAERANSVTEGWHMRPSIAGLPGGGAVVVWEKQSYEIRLRWLDEAGAPLGSEEELVAAADPRDPWVYDSSPAVAVSADGSVALVLWTATVDWEGELRGALYDVASGERAVAGELAVSGLAEWRVARYASVAHLSEGGFFVAWTAVVTGAGGGEALGRWVSPEGEMGETVQLSEGHDGSYGAIPSVAQRADGSLVVGWHEHPNPDGLPWGVGARPFALDDPAAGPLPLSPWVTLAVPPRSMQQDVRLATSGAALAACFTDGSWEGEDTDDNQVRCLVLPAGWVVE